MRKEELNYYAEYFGRQQGQKYPCRNQEVRCAVFAKDRINAFCFMKSKGATVKRILRDQIQWLLDGELWEWRDWNMSYRGYRFYKIAIDESVDDEIFYYLVLPYCANYCCSLEVM